MLPLAVALLFAAAPERGLPDALQQADDGWDAPAWHDEEREPRVRITAWGGEALGDSGSGRGSGFLGAEAGWSFERLDVGVAGTAFRRLDEADREWTPVVLARFTQRFKVRREVEAAFGFGLGAGRPKGWRAWYQLALGVRLPLGPLFVAGELAFEQYDLLRLGGGLGVAF